MPVNIEEVTSDVTVYEGELPLSQKQIDKLIELVLARLETKQRQAEDEKDTMMIRRRSMPSMSVDEW